jgi:hypothetical protein
LTIKISSNTIWCLSGTAKSIKFVMEDWMTRMRLIPRPTVVSQGVAFDTAQEAWLWAAFITRHGAGGGSLTAHESDIPKPCEPRDVISVACRLRRAGVLSGYEFGALCRYGAAECPPDPRIQEEVQDERYWSQALGKLTGPLQEKGIVKISPWANSATGKTHTGFKQGIGMRSDCSCYERNI